MAIQVFQKLINAAVNKSSTDYSTTRNATTGDYVSDVVSVVGQNFAGGNTYQNGRGFVGWDTSGLNDAVLITDAFLTLKAGSDYSTTDFDIVIRNGQPTYPHDTVEVGDYDISHYSGNGGSINTSEGYLVISLNSIGISWINKSGITKFVLMSSRDISETPPTGQEYVTYNTGTLTLTVTYYLPTETPTVTTINLACKDRQSTTLTATGNVTSAGGGYTYRGFEYYEYTGGIYDSSMYAVREIGRFASTGEFEMTLYGLKPSIVYYIRAYAGNVFGIDYGDWVLCSTTEVGSYGIYESTTSPTICFYLSEDDGMTWGQKHGPYTTDQADINVTKLLVRGVGKKKIKFTTTALTGISASVMVKLDCKAR